MCEEGKELLLLAIEAEVERRLGLEMENDPRPNFASGSLFMDAISDDDDDYDDDDDVLFMDVDHDTSVRSGGPVYGKSVWGKGWHHSYIKDYR